MNAGMDGLPKGTFAGKVLKRTVIYGGAVAITGTFVPLRPGSLVELVMQAPGGGGGRGSVGVSSAGQGAAAGGLKHVFTRLSGNQNYSIGAYGTGAVANNTAGLVGGDVIFGGHAAKGGALGGVGVTTRSVGGGPGETGYSSNGEFGGSGGGAGSGSSDGQAGSKAGFPTTLLAGSPGGTGAASNPGGGGGGDSPFGSGGVGGAGNTGSAGGAAGPSSGYGSGGGGGGCGAATTGNGTDGSPGFILVIEYDEG